MHAPSLFQAPQNVPLAEQLRPHALAEVIGQEHLTAASGVLGKMLAARSLQ